MRLKRQLMVFLIITTLIFGVFFQMPTYAEENLAEVNYVGPGRYETDLLIIQGGEILKNYEDVGTAAIWNTRNELFISLEVDEGWVIKEVMVYVGNDAIPTSESGNPLVAKFPYGEKLRNEQTSYEMSLKLVDDLDMSWGMRDEINRMPKVAICARIERLNSKKGTPYFAWAEGNNQFDVNSGWWSRYAVVHPKTGHFIDSPVGGVGYETPTHRGKTDDGGAFEYIQGEDVNLYIGEIYIGTARAGHKITPMDLIGTTDINNPAVINMAVMLQSFDENGEPNAGIEITSDTSEALEASFVEMGLSEIDFYDTDQVDTLIALTNDKLGGTLNQVSKEEAKDNLEKGTGSTIVRKNVSKSSEFENTKAKLELMPLYVPAQKANGDPVTLEYYETVLDPVTGEPTGEEILIETRTMVKPLISCYTEVIGDTGADDIIAAVSRDEGETWKTTNISKSADKSSFKLKDGTDFPGDTHKPQVRVSGNYILAVWTSKYAKTGKPTYAIKIEDETSEDYYPYDDPYYEEDIWGVSGPQRSFDYADLGFPEVGELPFSVVWACRGKIDVETGEITWYKPERLTSGRRDANQVMMNAVEGAGFAVVWQEDPEGLRPGEEAGPGEGWSGATTNHKTDIWYSYLRWGDFEAIDENFVSKGASQYKEDEEEEIERGRPKALVPFRLPVRLTDNDTLNLDNMKIDSTNISLPQTEYTWVDVDSSTFLPLIQDEKMQGTHQYGYVDLTQYYPYYSGPEICDMLYYEVNHQGADKYIAITGDGRLIDGNTGASRPNIMLQKYTKADGSISAWAAICYEETKGVGAGPPMDEEVDAVASATVSYSEGEMDTMASATISSSDGSGTGDGTGSGGSGEGGSSDGVGAQRGKYAYVADSGKNVIYHTFDFAQPDLVSAGHIINPQIEIDSEEEIAFYTREDGTLPGLDESTGLLYLTDEEGNIMYDWDGTTPLPAYENARRPRILIQGKSAAIAGKPAGTDGTVMVMLYKMGEEGKGRPSDIFMHRWEVSSLDKGNPYDMKYMSPDIYNISSVTPGDTIINENRSESSKGEGLKVLNWTQDVTNLDDDSWENPYDDARAHRGILRGDMLAIALDWTPNWSAARNGNDIYNLYVRRSFDGGKTFTTNPNGVGVTHTDIFKTGLGTGQGSEEREEDLKVEVQTFYEAGAFEPMRNLSHVSNNKTSVIEPRLVGGQGTIVGSPYPEDVRNVNMFWVTYGTSTNPAKGSTELKEPLDLYYSYTQDFGDTFYDITKTTNPESKGNHPGEEKTVWDWLAKDTGQKVAAQAECQIRMSADGSIFYAVWNETGDNGSDVMFRRIIPSGMNIRSIVEVIDETEPVIQVQGINDGDIINDTITLDVQLNELGTWEAELISGDSRKYYKDEFTIIADRSKRDYTLKVSAEDLSGNKSYKELSFTVDGQAPNINIFGAEKNEHAQTDIRLQIHTSGNKEHIKLLKDGQEINATNWALLTEEGNYVLDVTSEINGYLARKNLIFTIDRTAPKIVYKGVEDGGQYVGSVKPEVIITDNLSKSLQRLEIKLNGLDYLSSTQISRAGDYCLYVYAVDKAGNTAVSKINFIIMAAEALTSEQMMEE